jgi:hypothetical protein
LAASQVLKAHWKLQAFSWVWQSAAVPLRRVALGVVSRETKRLVG